MKLKDVFQILEKEYPLAISLQFANRLSIHDNSGILVNFDDEIRQILFTLDLTDAAVEKAIQNDVNCIITHHPVIFKPIKSLSATGENANLLKAIANKINIISMHLNADAAPKGIDYYLANALGLKKLKAVQHTILENCQYGRIYEIEKKTLDCILQECILEFKSDKMWLFGDKNREVTTVASFCGAGIDHSVIEFLKENNVELVVSSDIKHNFLVDLLELNIAVLQMTHYVNENYGFYKMYKDIERKLECKCHYFLEKLLEYQSKEEELRKIKQNIANSDEYKKYMQARKFLKQAPESLEALDKKAINYHDEFKAIQTKIEKLFANLNELDDATNVMTNEVSTNEQKYYEKNINKNFDTLKTLKEDYKKFMAFVAETEKNYQTLKKNHADMRVQMEQYGEKYNAIKKEHSQKITTLEEELQNLESKLPKSELAKYKSKREEKIFPVICSVIENRCSCCSMQLSLDTLNKLEQGVECESCGRILYKK